LSHEWIRNVLIGILLDHELVASMSRAAAGMGSRDADIRLAKQVLTIADRSGAVKHGGRGGSHRGGHRGGL
jgi:UDP-N-acetylglucosamine--N-acetylmuramyl-(pentapeptide) pyrophosphoryl-undecaprenol N-acetylglucosamine transferase